MKEISTQTIILPLIVVIVAVIVVSLISINSIKGVREGCDVVAGELLICQKTLIERDETLVSTLEKLNLTEQGLSKYDAIYDEASLEAEQLAQALEENVQFNVRDALAAGSIQDLEKWLFSEQALLLLQ